MNIITEYMNELELTWFIPALVNNNVGSSNGTTDEDGTNTCWRLTK